MSPSPTPSPAESTLAEALRTTGHVFLQAQQTRPLLQAQGKLDDWADFAASWNDMPLDTYMADGGRYRRRRYAVYRADTTGLRREPHQPHYQSLDYNPLNGGVERWFEPVLDATGASCSLHTVLRFCLGVFGRLAPDTTAWHLELHQFRIEAVSDQGGQPTPEGVHRDGVDYVLVLLIARHNIESGTTSIHDPAGQLLGSFTLTQPMDASLLDDRRVYHGVTPVQPLDPEKPAYRDVLVVTLRRLDATAM